MRRGDAPEEDIRAPRAVQRETTRSWARISLRTGKADLEVPSPCLGMAGARELPRRTDGRRKRPTRCPPDWSGDAEAKHRATQRALGTKPCKFHAAQSVSNEKIRPTLRLGLSLVTLRATPRQAQPAHPPKHWRRPPSAELELQPKEVRRAMTGPECPPPAGRAPPRAPEKGGTQAPSWGRFGIL